MFAGHRLPIAKNNRESKILEFNLFNFLDKLRGWILVELLIFLYFISSIDKYPWRMQKWYVSINALIYHIFKLIKRL